MTSTYTLLFNKSWPLAKKMNVSNSMGIICLCCQATNSFTQKCSGLGSGSPTSHHVSCYCQAQQITSHYNSHLLCTYLIFSIDVTGLFMSIIPIFNSKSNTSRNQSKQRTCILYITLTYPTLLTLQILLPQQWLPPLSH